MSTVLEYELRREDLEAFFRHHATHAPYIVARNRRWRWIWAVLLGLTGLVYWRLTPAGGVVLVGLAVLVFLFYARLNRWWYVRHNRRVNLGAEGPRLGRTSLTLDEERLRVEGPEGEARVELAAIRRIEETEAHHFVYLGPVTAAIVPRSVAGTDGFVAALRAAREARGARPPGR